MTLEDAAVAADESPEALLSIRNALDSLARIDRDVDHRCGRPLAAVAGSS
jgi:hypothetical protein